MQKIIYLLILSIALQLNFSFAQKNDAAKKWADSVYKTLTPDQRIAQLMVMRESGPNGIYVKETIDLINKYNIGAICMFQGEPNDQAMALNEFQRIAKTPLMVAIDGEMGLGMRMKTVKKFPDQLTMGAMNNKELVYEVGKAMAEQCKRMGIHVDYAPVIDINNNAANPVIGYRSFGENKYKVAEYGVQIIRGMEDNGVMASAKHYPGHGDVDVDSHHDLPVINKSFKQLDTLELYPFKKAIEANVGSIMIGHLSIPSLDSRKNVASSISKKVVTDLLKKQMGFKGITFTDALEMKGVAKFYPQGEISAESLIAGNDMLCLPGEIGNSLAKIHQAIRQRKLKWDDLEKRIKKVLEAKYHYGVADYRNIDTINLTADLNKDVDRLRKAVAEEAITAVKLANKNLLSVNNKKIAYVAMGSNANNTIGNLLAENFAADVHNVAMNIDGKTYTDLLLKLSDNTYDQIIIGFHDYKKSPAGNFGISASVIRLAEDIRKTNANTLLMTFGNPYAIKNFCEWENIISCYEDDEIFQNTAYELLLGKIGTKGQLPVTVCPALPYGTGIMYAATNPQGEVLPKVVPAAAYNFSKVDAIANDGIAKGAYPGCNVIVAKDGKIIYNQAYGYLDENKEKQVTPLTIYDLASVTKISATTVAIMKLYEEGKVGLDKTLGDYLPWVKNSDKSNITVRELLLHQGGLVSWIPFFRETIDEKTGDPLKELYRKHFGRKHHINVAKDLYLKDSYINTMYDKILSSKLGAKNKYVYSDNDFIFLGKIVEAVSGMNLDKYVKEHFYYPLEMFSTTFNPLVNGKPIDLIAPTEKEEKFRKQTIRGYVHDPGAAMFGGIAGHAGLFSNGEDLAKLYLMLLNGGSWNGRQFFKKETIDLFTSHQSNISRRGLGFDKPERIRKAGDNYPAYRASEATFGHTGFTGTCVWADPKENLLFIFLSNRVHPNGQNPLLGRMDIRENIFDAIYEAIRKR